MSHRLKIVLSIILLLVLLLLTPLSKGNGGISPTPPTPLPPPPVPTVTTTPSPTTITPTLPEPTTNTPEPITPPAPSVPQFYTVLPGETLWEIAGKLGINMEDLVVANHLTDANLIYAGQELYIGTVPIIVPEPTILEGKQIIVILSTQRVYTFEDGILLKEFIVSTGTSNHPTVTGEYEIYEKHEFDDMSGGVKGIDYYYLADVPWTMYFHKGYGFHGTYWHSNFGHPMSHGCINMYTPDAEWLFKWAPIDTPITIIP